jgi:phage shock protein A
LQEKDAREWEEAARRSLKKGEDADAREAMRRCEEAERQATRLRDQLADQEKDTAEIRDSVRLMKDSLSSARERLQILQARMRQTEARQSMNKVMRGVESANLYGEFDRLGERVERRAAEEAAYLRLDAEMSGEDVKRRFEQEAVDDAVKGRLARMRAKLKKEEKRTAKRKKDNRRKKSGA